MSHSSRAQTHTSAPPTQFLTKESPLYRRRRRIDATVDCSTRDHDQGQIMIASITIQVDVRIPRRRPRVIFRNSSVHTGDEVVWTRSLIARPGILPLSRSWVRQSLFERSGAYLVVAHTISSAKSSLRIKHPVSGDIVPRAVANCSTWYLIFRQRVSVSATFRNWRKHCSSSPVQYVFPEKPSADTTSAATSCRRSSPLLGLGTSTRPDH